jgi:hypothetical protein
MSSAYFAPLVTRPIIITKPGSYRTRSGEVVTITKVSILHDFGCEGTYSDGTQEFWHKSGRIQAHRETSNDITEAVTV